MPGAKHVYVDAPQPRASSCLWGCPQRWLAAMGPRLAPPLGTPLAPRGLGEDPWHRLTSARAGSRSLPGALGQSAGETLRAVTAHGLDPFTRIAWLRQPRRGKYGPRRVHGHERRNPPCRAPTLCAASRSPSGSAGQLAMHGRLLGHAARRTGPARFGAAAIQHDSEVPQGSLHTNDGCESAGRGGGQVRSAKWHSRSG